jgi:hypothetical protein
MAIWLQHPRIASFRYLVLENGSVSGHGFSHANDRQKETGFKPSSGALRRISEKYAPGTPRRRALIRTSIGMATLPGHQLSQSKAPIDLPLETLSDSSSPS